MALLKKKALVFCLITALICSLLIDSTEGDNNEKQKAGSEAKAAGPHRPHHESVQTQVLSEGPIDKKCKKGVPQSLCSLGVMEEAEGNDPDDEDDDDTDDDDGDAAFVEDKSVKTVVLGH